MKILIAYAGKSGGTHQMCTLLASLLPNHTVTLLDLNKDTLAPSDFDYLVLGGAVRYGRLHRAVRKYVKTYREEICRLPHTLFLCCAFAEQFENYVDMVYPRDVVEKADEALYFGGELKPENQRGIERFIAKTVRNSILNSEDDEAALPGLLPEHVRLLAGRLRAM